MRRLTNLGNEVWAYEFDRNGTMVTAIWTPDIEKLVTVDVGDARHVKVVDIMGQSANICHSECKGDADGGAGGAVPGAQQATMI